MPSCGKYAWRPCGAHTNSSHCRLCSIQFTVCMWNKIARRPYSRTWVRPPKPTSTGTHVFMYACVRYLSRLPTLSSICHTNRTLHSALCAGVFTALYTIHVGHFSAHHILTTIRVNINLNAHFATDAHKLCDEAIWFYFYDHKQRARENERIKSDRIFGCLCARWMQKWVPQFSWQWCLFFAG